MTIASHISGGAGAPVPAVAGFAREVADPVVFMHHEQVVEDDLPEAFFTRPQSARAREFLRQVIHKVIQNHA